MKLVADAKSDLAEAVFAPRTTVTQLPAFRAHCLCGWDAEERWRRWDEAASDLHAHIRAVHPELIELLSIKRTVIEETSKPNMAEGDSE